MCENVRLVSLNNHENINAVTPTCGWRCLVATENFFSGIYFLAKIFINCDVL